jgi:hypothetical protein
LVALRVGPAEAGHNGPPVSPAEAGRYGREGDDSAEASEKKCDSKKS